MKLSSVSTPVIIANTFLLSVLLFYASLIQQSIFLAFISIVCICFTLSLAVTA